MALQLCVVGLLLPSASAIKFALTGFSGPTSTVKFRSWSLSFDGSLLMSVGSELACPGPECALAATLSWATIGSDSSTTDLLRVPNPAHNGQFFYQSYYITNSAQCGPLIVGIACFHPVVQRGNLICTMADGDTFVAFYPLLPQFQNSSCDSQLIPYPASVLTATLSPSGRFLFVVDTSTSMQILERFDHSNNTRSMFNSTPAIAIQSSYQTVWSGPQQQFACEDDACFAYPLDDYHIGWYVRTGGASTGQWEQRAVLTVPSELVPPELLACLYLSTYRVSWIGSAADDDALVFALLLSKSSPECNRPGYPVYDAIVVWSSGIPGVNEGPLGNNWTSWQATLIREPFPEYSVAFPGLVDWTGYTADGERTFVVAWFNQTRVAAGNSSVPYDEVTIYKVPVNTSSAAYSSPVVAQSIPCCPPGTIAINEITGQPYPNQLLNSLSAAPTGGRFTLNSMVYNRSDSANSMSSVNQLWSDMDAYPPPSPPDQYPAWIVPTTLGTTGGLLAAAALLGVLYQRVRRQWRTKQAEGARLLADDHASYSA